MLGEHNITYRPRKSVKGQILADFLVEKPDESPPNTSVVETLQEPWTLFIDGSSCVDRSGASLILTSPEGTKFTYALRFQFTASNNEAEYESLIAGLRIAAQMGVHNVHVSVDYKLVANQVLGAYVTKEENMIKYLEKVKSLVSSFANFSISQKGPFQKIKRRQANSVSRPDSMNCGKGVIYRRSFLKPWLQCVGPLQADYVIREIHEGSCSMHVGPRYVVANAMRLGYYWPTMHRDERNWGIDIAGPFPEGPGNVKFLMVALDYFTKWIEAKAVSTITGNQVKKFVWENKVCRFGLPGEIVLDNSKQFTVIPAEIGMPTYRTMAVDVVHNDEELRLKLDLLEERHEQAAIHEAKAKSQMTKYYNARVRGVTFRPGDFVYHSNDASHAVTRGKLRPM
ncbi:reverse transcriptase domain-containing protein [Tanacetum coccineum]